MIQGGCPDGTGMGGPGYCIKGEFAANGVHNDLRHTRGVLSMARAQAPDSAGSQFFIMHKDAPHLDGQYAAFGMVIDGMDVVDEIVSAAPEHDHQQAQEAPGDEVRHRGHPGRGVPGAGEAAGPLPQVKMFSRYPGRLSRPETPPVPYTGLYRFRRGCGGRISGRRRLTAIKRATLKLTDNNRIAVAA